MRKNGWRLRGPLEAERAEVDEFVERQVETAEGFLTVVGFGGRKVSARSLKVAEFLKERRFWNRAGCVALLIETEHEYLVGRGPCERNRIVEELEAKFERYFAVLKEGGYL